MSEHSGSSLHAEVLRGLIPPTPPNPYGSVRGLTPPTQTSPYESVIKAFELSKSSQDRARTNRLLVQLTSPTPPYLSGSVSRVPEPSESSDDKARMKSRLIEWYGLFCVGCDRWFDHERYLELDHEVPKSRGGSDDIRNRRLLCHPCNNIKGDRLTLHELREKNLTDGVMASSPNHDPAWVRVGRSGKWVKDDYTILHAPGAWDGYTWRVTYRDTFIGGGTTHAEAISFVFAHREARRYSRPSM